eukprot:m.62739 g.62739  ORF g.62739 m.62739 type:complete len:299 (-) comp15811_c0_seq1:457-1353(-)
MSSPLENQSGLRCFRTMDGEHQSPTKATSRLVRREAAVVSPSNEETIDILSDGLADCTGENDISSMSWMQNVINAAQNSETGAPDFDSFLRQVDMLVEAEQEATAVSEERTRGTRLGARRPVDNVSKLSFRRAVDHRESLDYTGESQRNSVGSAAVENPVNNIASGMEHLMSPKSVSSSHQLPRSPRSRRRSSSTSSAGVLGQENMMHSAFEKISGDSTSIPSKSMRQGSRVSLGDQGQFNETILKTADALIERTTGEKRRSLENGSPTARRSSINPTGGIPLSPPVVEELSPSVSAW